MAGHSKWVNIRYRKARQDAKKGKSFTKLIREISVAARLHGREPTSNPRLRLAIDHALAQNMTRDTVKRAIHRAVQPQQGAHLAQVRYEGYGPGGAALIVECVTDNRNRTVSEVRNAFSKFGGQLGAEGAVNFLFRHQGYLALAKGLPADQLLELMEQEGIEDIDHETPSDREQTVIYTQPASLFTIAALIKEYGLECLECSLDWVPVAPIMLAEAALSPFQKLVDRLEELDDVQDVYHNVQLGADLDV